MHVLNLITSPDVPPYRQQIAAVRRQGIRETTLGVPGRHDATDDDTDGRSMVDYLRFYPRVLRASFGEYDLVHANYGLTGPAAVAQPNLPVVLSLWGSDLFGTFGPVSKWCARQADAVIVMSEEMADEVPGECYVIPHGVNLDLFRPMPAAAARQAVGWRDDAAHVLFPYPTGRPEKDFPRAKRVVEAASQQVEGDVVLQSLRGTDHTRVPLFMNAADAMLMTSKWEGSPNTVKEAMACNLPVVSTDVGDVRERLDGVEPSHVGETDAALVEGLVDVIRRGKPSNGRPAIAPLGLDTMGERIRAVYESVVDQAPSVRDERRVQVPTG